MTTFAIKLLAMTTMVVDHVGLYFFPQYMSLRILGRLSFILFAWLIANGAKHTKDIKKYFIRLFILGLVSQYPFYLLNNLSGVIDGGLNIGFTLSLGLLMVIIYSSGNSKYLKLLYCMIVLALGFIADVDYGVAGILTILLFYVYFDDFKKSLLAQSVVYLIFYTIPLLIKFINVGELELVLTSTDIMRFIQPFALFSLVFIYLYDKRQGYKDGYILYLFYPVHFVFMVLIKYLMLK